VNQNIWKFLGILKEKSMNTFANVFLKFPVFLYHKIWGGGGRKNKNNTG
jgi:hypothetical protein